MAESAARSLRRVLADIRGRRSGEGSVGLEAPEGSRVAGHAQAAVSGFGHGDLAGEDVIAGQDGRTSREHCYRATITWTGNLGEGTAGYRSCGRDHEASGKGKPMLPGSSDPAFRRDPSGARRNPLFPLAVLRQQGSRIPQL